MAEENFNAGNADINNITITTGGGAVDEYEPGSTAFEGNAEDAASENGEKRYGGISEAPTPGEPDADGIIEYVNKEMLISDIVTWYPDATLVLMKVGMHCISCFAAQMETLEQAAMVHGYDPDDVAKIVNDYLTQTLGQKDTESDTKTE